MLTGFTFISELYAVARPSVVCRICLSVTFVRPTQAFEIFGNISTAFGTLAIRWHPLQNVTKIVPGEPLRRGVKHKRGSQV